MKEYKIVVQKQEMGMSNGEKLQVGTTWLMENDDGYIKMKPKGEKYTSWGWGHWGSKDDFEDWFEITNEEVNIIK